MQETQPTQERLAPLDTPLSSRRLVIDWDAVDSMARAAGIYSDAELARRMGTLQSNVTRWRRDGGTIATLSMLKVLFPAADLERLVRFELRPAS